MRVRCPHCNNHAELDGSANLSNISCESCGSEYSLIPEETLDLRQNDRQTFGHFELLDQLGVGAFGTVWRARDTQLDRTVALKIPRKGQLDAAETEQFLREARAAAQLKHPNIVAVHEVGREDGQVYIVSDYVEGLTLADWLVGQQPTARTAAELCEKLAEAVHHAHEAGVIHRDLKPTNIILDAKNEPHVMDFGLAKREAGEVTMTMEGKVIGTPAYMSPEQARGDAHQADRRSDVYALGVILYELLTTHKPFRGNVRMLMQQVINDEPPSPRRLNGAIPRDMETICLKCLEKEPRNRYSTAGKLAAELERFSAGQPIDARPISRPARAWRWCRRNPVVAALGAGLAAVLLILGIGGPASAVKQARLAARNEQLADNEAVAREATRRRLYVSDMNVAVESWKEGKLEQLQDLLERHEPEVDQVDLRGFEWYYLQRLVQQAASVPTMEFDNRITHLTFAATSETLAMAAGTEVSLIDSQTRQILHQFEPHVASSGEPPTGLWGLASPLVRPLLATVTRGEFKLWDVAVETSPVELAKRACDVPGRSAAFSPNGKFLAIGDMEGVTIWLTEPVLEPLKRIDVRREIRNVALSDHTLAFGKYLHSSAVWVVNVEGDEPPYPLEGHISGMSSLAFSPDGRLLVSGNQDSLIKLWDVESRQELATLAGHRGAVWSLAFSPRGDSFASIGLDMIVRIWDASHRKLLKTLKSHHFGNTRSLLWSSGRRLIHYSSDSSVLVSAGSDNTVRWWGPAIADQSSTILAGHGGWVHTVAFSPDGSQLISAANTEKELKLWDVASGRELKHSDFTLEPWYVSYASDGKSVAFDQRSTVRFWDVSAWRESSSLKTPYSNKSNNPVFPNETTISLDGTKLVAATREGTAILDSGSGEVLYTLSESGAIQATFSSDGEHLATLDRDGKVRILTTSSFELVKEFIGHSREHVAIMDIGYSPDDNTLATLSDEVIQLWDAGSGKLKATLTSTSPQYRLAFSPDGTTLATCGMDGIVRLWSVELQAEVAALEGHQGAVACVAFSPDGTILASSGGDATIRLWRAAKRDSAESH